MEHLFSPCTRYRELLESPGRRVPPEWLRELNLEVPTDEFLSAERGFTYADLYAVLGNGGTIAWLTPHAFLVGARGRGMLYCTTHQEYSCHIYFTVDGNQIFAWARSSAALSEIYDVVLRLLAVSVVHLVILRKRYHDGVSINAASLAYLMEQCQSLKTLALQSLEMDENHCRVIGAYSRPDLEIELIYCAITDAGASVLAEILGRNQGPTKLDRCTIDNFVLADGLRGNSRLKHMILHICFDKEEGARQVLAMADALRENKGLVEWRLRRWGGYLVMNDETWGTVCDSLKTHPTLEILDLSRILINYAAFTQVVTMSRVQALLGMMEVNASIRRIDLDSGYSEHEIYRRSVIPYLETNWFRPRVRAIQKTRPITYRAKVLGRALLAVRSDANRFWMLLSGNAELAFPSTAATIATIAAAASLPAPGIAAATSNTAAITATAAVSGTAIRAASSTGVSTVESVAIPTASKKRKVRL
jgi:hypothetical protein